MVYNCAEKVLHALDGIYYLDNKCDVISYLTSLQFEMHGFILQTAMDHIFHCFIICCPCACRKAHNCRSLGTGKMKKTTQLILIIQERKKAAER